MVYITRGDTHETAEEKNPYMPGELRYIIYAALDRQPKSVQQIYDSPVWENMGTSRPDISRLQTELFYMRMQGEVKEGNGRFCLRR